MILSKKMPYGTPILEGRKTVLFMLMFLQPLTKTAPFLINARGCAILIRNVQLKVMSFPAQAMKAYGAE
jgi:hypothetical protein